MKYVRFLISTFNTAHLKKAYFIAEASKNETNLRMLEAFDMFNLLNIKKDIAIHFENRKLRGTEHFYGLLHAITNHIILRLTHQKFEDEAVTNRDIEPYLLKEFKGRWYLVARDLSDGIAKSFGLDRIIFFEFTKEHFNYTNDLNPSDLFRNCFGVTNSSEGEPQEIILSFVPFQGKYIKSFPLHETQIILLDNSQEVRISLKLFVTHELIMELLSYGDNI